MKRAIDEIKRAIDEINLLYKDCSFPNYKLKISFNCNKSRFEIKEGRNIVYFIYSNEKGYKCLTNEFNTANSLLKSIIGYYNNEPVFIWSN